MTTKRFDDLNELALNVFVKYKYMSGTVAMWRIDNLVTKNNQDSPCNRPSTDAEGTSNRATNAPESQIIHQKRTWTRDYESWFSERYAENKKYQPQTDLMNQGWQLFFSLTDYQTDAPKLKQGYERTYSASALINLTTFGTIF